MFCCMFYFTCPLTEQIERLDEGMSRLTALHGGQQIVEKPMTD